MGRTVLPYSQVWEEERSRWLKFRRALRKEDKVHLDRLFELARLHLQAGVYASNPRPLEYFSTSGNSDGWYGLIGNPTNYQKITFGSLSKLSPDERLFRLKSTLDDAKVRYSKKKSR